MSLPDPAEGHVANEFTALVRSRESLYASMGDRLVDLPEPRVNKAYALYAREVVHVPLGVTAGSALLFSTMETLGAWAVVPAAAAGLAVVFTGLRAKFSILTPHIPHSLRADVAQAHDDFRAALSAVDSPDTPVDVVMAVRAFEPRMEHAMRTLFDPRADPEAGIPATQTVLAIGSRTWALTTLEERRRQVIASVVGTDVEPVADALHEAVESSPPDFAEIHSVAASISRETDAMVKAMDAASRRRRDPA